MKPLRVLLIGSGKRIQNNFIPALQALPEKFTIIGIHSRTREHYERVAKEKGIPPIHELTAELYASVDVVAISVSPGVWPIFLSRMKASAPHINLVVDTPLVLHGLSLFRKLSQFKNVIATEDYISFPQFTLLRIIADSGALGKIRSVRLMHNGYRYHGTSLIRSFFDYALAERFTSRFTSPDNIDMRLDLPGNAYGEIIEPYEGHMGHIEIMGERGGITSAEERGDFTYQIKPEIEHGEVVAYVAQISDKKYHLPLVYSSALRDMGLTDQFQIDKVHGLIQTFLSCVEFNTHSRYHFTDALYDNYVSRVPRIAPVSINDIAVRWFGQKVTRSLFYWVYWRFISAYVRIKGKLIRIARGI